MSLQFLLGPSGSGKSTEVYKRIIKESMEAKDQLFYLMVPEQYTMEAQRDIVTLHPKKGTLNIDAIGFNRFAYRIFDELGVETLSVLEDFGKSMLIKKILCQNAEKLKVYGKSMDKMGFVDEMKSMLSELFQYDIDKDDVAASLEKLDKDSVVREKLEDLTLIYEEFEKFTADKYIVAEELTEMLSLYVKKSDIVKKSSFYFDGFTGFTPVQMKVIKELLKAGRNLVFVFDIDCENISLHNIKEHELFYLSKTTMRDLIHLAKDTGTEILDNIYMDELVPYRFKDNEELAFLEKNLFRYPYKKYENGLHNISITSGKDAKEEITFIASTIISYVRTGKYRFKDFAVITGDLTSTSRYFEDIMGKYNIPLFIDANTSLKSNPCLESIRSVISIFAEDFSYDSVFRFLKSGMTDIEDNDISRFDNYITKVGIRGYKAYQKEIPEEYCKGLYIGVEETRKKFMSILEPLAKVFLRKEKTVKDMAVCIYNFIDKNNYYDKIQQHITELENNLELDMAAAYSQIFDKLIKLFDKMIELLGDEIMSSDSFYEVMDAGLSDIKIGTVPPNVDRVLVGDITRSRINHTKILFFPAVNDGVIPKASKKGKILNDGDRKTIEKTGLVLAPSDQINAFVEQFYLYQGITKPTEKLYISYRKLDEKLTSSKPSYIISRICNIFPKLEIQEFSMDLDHIDTKENVLNAAIKYSEQSQSVFALLSQVLKERALSKELEAVNEGLAYKNVENNLSTDTLILLYGSKLVQSVSKLEQFVKCQFAYFVKYGLGLNEKETYDIDVRNVGNILHEIMEKVFVRIRDHHSNNWDDLSEENLNKMVEDTILDASENNAGTYFQDLNRNKYMLSMIERMAKRSVWTMQKQIVAGHMRPELIEKKFDSEEDDIESFMYKFDQEASMKVLGKIDRVDVTEENGDVYIKIVDYKSSSKELKVEDILSGLQLQLVAYSSVAYELEKQIYPDKQIRPAGLLYYSFDDPFVELKDGMIVDDEQGYHFQVSDKADKERLENLKLKGFVNENVDVMSKMDNELNFSLPVKLDKNGEPKKAKNILSEEKLKKLMNITTEKIYEVGQGIYNGDIAKEPYKDGKFTGCDYCAYKAICRFDPKYGGNSYKTFDVSKKLEEFEEE